MSVSPAQQPKEVFDVFLCHNGADKDWVRQVAEQIESETFDGHSNGRPLRVFFDEWDIDVGQNVLLRINRGLTASRYVAVVISPEMLEAPWPGLEWTHVVADDRRGRIIPLFLRDYSESLKQHAELPAPFKALNWIDFRQVANEHTPASGGLRSDPGRLGFIHPGDPSPCRGFGGSSPDCSNDQVAST